MGESKNLTFFLYYMKLWFNLNISKSSKKLNIFIKCKIMTYKLSVVNLQPINICPLLFMTGFQQHIFIFHLYPLWYVIKGLFSFSSSENSDKSENK